MGSAHAVLLCGPLLRSPFNSGSISLLGGICADGYRSPSSPNLSSASLYAASAARIGFQKFTSALGSDSRRTCAWKAFSWAGDACENPGICEPVDVAYSTADWYWDGP